MCVKCATARSPTGYDFAMTGYSTLAGPSLLALVERVNDLG